MTDPTLTPEQTIRLRCLEVAKDVRTAESMVKWVTTGVEPARRPLEELPTATVLVVGGRIARQVRITVPVDAEPGERCNRIELMKEGGHWDEAYLAPTLDSAIAVATRLLRGEEVPKNYFITTEQPDR